MDLSYLPDQFWRVNSYGYPSPFGDNHRALDAYKTLRSFSEHQSYSALKSAWQSGIDGRKLSSHAVESWKAAFEEYGLVYVLSGSDDIHMTPASKQLFQAVSEDNLDEFVWVGMNLLLRFPLSGPPRRARNDVQGRSDLLVYRFLLAAVMDLDNIIWWTEAERILCRLFLTRDAGRVVEDVKALRGNPMSISECPVISDYGASSFYNSLNQVFVHASLNSGLLTKTTTSSLYGDGEKDRSHAIGSRFLPLVRLALGGTALKSDCFDRASHVSCLPSARMFGDEQEYFDYLGAEVAGRDSLTGFEGEPDVQAGSIGGDQVFILKAPDSRSGIESMAKGNQESFCVLSVGSRVIFSSDSSWTHIITGKEMSGPGEIMVTLRRARPITDSSAIETLGSE
jgi:hypothetical protein